MTGDTLKEQLEKLNNVKDPSASERPKMKEYVQNANTNNNNTHISCFNVNVVDGLKNDQNENNNLAFNFFKRNSIFKDTNVANFVFVDDEEKLSEEEEESEQSNDSDMEVDFDDKVNK